ncbi:MAG: N-acetylmuramic acid 6-phosphate etherase [Terracidiphilus sp.]|jgi:N-acetylmuramic acid 6-phosphate etherase
MVLSGLETERQNRASSDLDKSSALEIATLMNREDAKALRAVREALPEIAKAIDVAYNCLAKGGRLIYVGSGTSGRIGALDASECAPTFGIDPSIVQYVMAGGERALANATEASEDSSQLGRSDMAARKPGKRDVVVGLAASGRTPYTIAALKYAAKKGATTVAVICNRDSELARVAQIAIEAEVGPEVLTGSTRLKAGTAQKLICNMISTGAMARLGYVYGNLMVHLRLNNEKLIERGISIVQRIAKVNRVVALATLKTANMKLPVALVMLCAKVSKTEAVRRLRRAQGSVRKAIEA